MAHYSSGISPSVQIWYITQSIRAKELTQMSKGQKSSKMMRSKFAGVFDSKLYKPV